MKRATIILAALLVSCSTSEETINLMADGVARFSSDISTRVSTDLSTNVSTWEAGDQIGISMYSSKASAYTHYNTPYEAQSSGTSSTSFEVVEGAEKILYPNSGTVTFAAYSPYSSEVSDNKITIDVSDQSTEAARNACDFMLSTNGTGSYLTSNEDIALEFEHQMAMLRFDVKCNETMSDLTGLEVFAMGIISTQTYSVLDGTASDSAYGNIVMWSDVTTVADGSDTATVTAIVHPGWTDGGVGLIFRADGVAVSAAISDMPRYDANNIYKYDVTIGNNYVDISEECDITAWVDNSTDSIAPDVTYNEDIVYNQATDTWEVYTAAGLWDFAAKVSESTDGSVNGLLMADIDLEGSEESPWTPIQSSSTSYNFYIGTFDGGNHLISGLYINDPFKDNSSLFYKIGTGGVVKNLGVSGSVTGLNNVGGIAGVVVNGSVLNCYNMATIGGAQLGGVVGSMSSSGVVMNCYNMGVVTGTSFYVGGIVGSLQNSSVINCYNSGAVTFTTSTATTTFNIGGIVGNVDDGETLSSVVSNCYNSGVVTVLENTLIYGGVVGGNNGGSINNCYWADDVGSNVMEGIGDGTGTATAMSAEEMKTAAFAATLNGNVSGDMFSWTHYFGVNGGYPTMVVAE